jgi:pimeloyl-ACP methyl ester carboxylesterase
VTASRSTSPSAAPERRSCCCTASRRPTSCGGTSPLCPDLRGYGDSGKPADTGETYSKRTMAADVVALARAFGHDRFALAGHDRGALVAIRAGLDHPDANSHLAVLDVLPTLDMWDVLQGVRGAVGFHLDLMAQPPGLPEALIGGAPETFYGHFLDAWTQRPDAIPADIRAEYLRASDEATTSIVADYRATATIDVEHDTADREAGNRLGMPVTVLQQDWGAALVRALHGRGVARRGREGTAGVAGPLRIRGPESLRGAGYLRLLEFLRGTQSLSSEPTSLAGNRICLSTVNRTGETGPQFRRKPWR